MKLVSASREDGVPAGWVQTCSCPPGYEGDFCERCSAGFRRRVPADAAFSPCEPCSCKGGSCDPLTGDCYSADETPGERTCPEGFYRNPRLRDTCVMCPCAEGVSCSLAPGSLEPRCDRCPPGTTGESTLQAVLCPCGGNVFFLAQTSVHIGPDALHPPDTDSCCCCSVGRRPSPALITLMMIVVSPPQGLAVMSVRMVSTAILRALRAGGSPAGPVGVTVTLTSAWREAATAAAAGV